MASASYRFACLLTKSLVVATAISGIIFQVLLCGGGGGPDPSPDEMSQEQFYPGGYCLPWLFIALPTIISGGWAIRGAAASDRSAWLVGAWLVFEVTWFVIAWVFGTVFPVIVAMWVLGFFGLVASVVAVRNVRTTA